MEILKLFRPKLEEWQELKSRAEEALPSREYAVDHGLMFVDYTAGGMEAATVGDSDSDATEFGDFSNLFSEPESESDADVSPAQGATSISEGGSSTTKRQKCKLREGIKKKSKSDADASPAQGATSISEGGPSTTKRQKCKLREGIKKKSESDADVSPAKGATSIFEGGPSTTKRQKCKPREGIKKKKEKHQDDQKEETAPKAISGKSTQCCREKPCAELIKSSEYKRDKRRICRPCSEKKTLDPRPFENKLKRPCTRHTRTAREILGGDVCKALKIGKQQLDLVESSKNRKYNSYIKGRHTCRSIDNRDVESGTDISLEHRDRFEKRHSPDSFSESDADDSIYDGKLRTKRRKSCIARINPSEKNQREQETPKVRTDKTTKNFREQSYEKQTQSSENKRDKRNMSLSSFEKKQSDSRRFENKQSRVRYSKLPREIPERDDCGSSDDSDTESEDSGRSTPRRSGQFEKEDELKPEDRSIGRRKLLARELLGEEVSKLMQKLEKRSQKRERRTGGLDLPCSSMSNKKAKLKTQSYRETKPPEGLDKIFDKEENRLLTLLKIRHKLDNELDRRNISY